MNRRRLAALAALCIVGAGVVALMITAGDDDASVAEPAAPPVTGSQLTDPDDDRPVDPDTPDATSDDATTDRVDDRAETTGTDPEPLDVETPREEAEVAPLRYDPELVPELLDRGPHLPLTGIDGWQQSDVSSLEELRGKVVAVQFWTFGCSNCKATKPHMAALYEKYGGEDFEIVGIHSPEFDFERDPDRIAEAAVDLNVTWPIALDTDKRTFRSWQTGRRFWPRIYLIDRDGNVRYDKIGEGRYDEIDAAVGALIDEEWDGDAAVGFGG